MQSAAGRSTDTAHDSTLSEIWSGPLPGITPQNGFQFRRGQELFLRKLASAFEHGDTYQLGVFVPGYGKTITALSSFIVALRSEEHTSELQSRGHLVCRLLLEK